MFALFSNNKHVDPSYDSAINFVTASAPPPDKAVDKIRIELLGLLESAGMDIVKLEARGSVSFQLSHLEFSYIGLRLFIFLKASDI